MSEMKFDIAKFEATVRDELKGLSREQRLRFAWLCVVRALPVLGGRGSFEFWKRNKKQRNIGVVFFVLDISAACATTDAPAYAVAVDATDAADAADAEADAAYAAAYTVAGAADAATYAAYDADSDVAPGYAAGAYADARAAARAAQAAYYYDINLTEVILNDLQLIKKESPELSEFPIANYGEVWPNFISALEAEGCGYWGRLYQSIFENGFKLDQEALKRRINVPREIRAEGAARVAAYLEELEAGARRLDEARVIILGDKGAGKTCIARRLIDPDVPMTTEKDSTAGVNTSDWALDDDINVRVWDFAGHTVTHAVHQFFLSERCLYLMVYDGRSEERNRLEYWLNHMKNYGAGSQAIILVNLRDCHRPEIPIYRLQEKYPIAGVYYFNVDSDRDALIAFRQTVADFIRNNPSWEKQQIPNSYYHVKEALEALFEQQNGDEGREYISRDHFNEIAQQHEVKDKDELLKNLHSLGVSLWYEGMDEFNTLVLNPEWISHGVYKIVNWVNEAKRHSITLDEFAEVFNEDVARYPADKHRFLFRLMKHYELAFETEGNAQLIIPHLLNEDRPKSLPDYPVGESLMLRYKAEQPLPPNTISRFIVRHNEQIKRESRTYVVWRYGVVLEDGKGSTALVREDDRTISVAVKGENKTNYISTLRDTLDAIFGSYKSGLPALQYRIEWFGQIPDRVEAMEPLWVGDKEIVNHVENGRSFYDSAHNREIPLGSVMNIYKIETKNLVLGGREHKLVEDNSTNTTFNFYDCNVGLQGELNELSHLLGKNGHSEEAEELQSAAEMLEHAENCDDPKEIKKRGFTNGVRRILEALEDEQSTLHKGIKGIKGVKKGIGIAQDMAEGYNKIAEWSGLPQVPKPFLK